MLINKVNDLNIQLVRGDTLSFVFEIEGLDVDLTTAYFTVKENPDDESPVFEKSLTNGISKVTTGKYLVKVAPTDTKYLDINNYSYDLEISVGNDVYTVMKGTLKLVQDITVK